MVMHVLDRGYDIEANQWIFANNTQWKIIPGSNFEEGEIQNLVVDQAHGLLHPRE
jgi:hypothetical protein